MRELTVLEKLHEAIGGLQMLNAVVESQSKGGIISEQIDSCVQDLIDVETALRSRDDELVSVTQLKIGIPRRDDHEE